MYVEYSGSIVQFLKQLIMNYTVNNGYWYLYAFFACIVVILFLRSKDLRIIFAWPAILFFVFIFNPLSIFVFEKLHIISTGRFYRFFWILPVVILSAFILTWICFKIKNKVAFVFALIVVSFFLAFLGNYENTKNLYVKADNIYKIPNNIIEISEMIHEDYEGKTPVLYYNDWIMMYYRTYDPNVISFRARGENTSALPPEVLQQYIDSKYTKTILERIIIYNEKSLVAPQELKNYVREIDYIVTEEFYENRGYYEEAGLEYLGTFDGYELYKNI